MDTSSLFVLVYFLIAPVCYVGLAYHNLFIK